MGRKRKLPPNYTQSAQLEQPPLIHPQQQPPQLDLEEAEYEEVEEEVEVEVEVEEEEEVEQEQEQDPDAEEQEEEDNDVVEDNVNIPDHDQTAKVPSTSSAPAADDDDDPILKLLEPLGKDQIASLLREAATNHRDVADRIRKISDVNPSHRKIFVHGLGWDTTTETLAATFRQYGEIEDCKAVADKVSGKSKGYGFILFRTRRGARKALQEPQKKIGNRMTACQLASMGPVQQPAQPNNSAAPVTPVGSEHTQRKIYVSNVGSELDPQRLLAFFSRFGEIEEGPLGLDKVTGKPKGFCLFSYKNVESAKRALEEPHKEFEGNILHCQKAIDGHKLGKSQQQQHQRMAMPTTVTTQFQRNDNSGLVAATPGHLMAPAGQVIGFNQGAAAGTQMMNPALGQALTALLASQGAGLGLNNLLGTLGLPAAVNPTVPAAGHGMQVGYNSQANVNPGILGGYGNQVGLQGAYQNQQVGQGAYGRGQQQHGVGQYGGVAPYTGH